MVARQLGRGAHEVVSGLARLRPGRRAADVEGAVAVAIELLDAELLHREVDVVVAADDHRDLRDRVALRGVGSAGKPREWAGDVLIARDDLEVANATELPLLHDETLVARRIGGELERPVGLRIGVGLAREERHARIAVDAVGDRVGAA